MSEREPLLTPPSGFSSPPTAPSGPKRLSTPVPWRQLIVLCLMRLAEPIASGVIYPFVNEMVATLHIAKDPSQVGYYAGVIESVFGFTQCMTVLTWGRLSDKWGRRPIILLGIFGVILSTLSFGFGKAFWWLIASRCINGALNGNVPAIKSVVGEITDASNAAQAFALLPLFHAVGGIIGPAIGGYLPNPAERFPSVFRGVWLFEEFPYLLPCLAASSVTFLFWIIAFFFLEESLESKTKPKHHASLLRGEADLRIADETGINNDDDGDDGAEGIERNAAPPYTPGIREILASSTVRSVLHSYAWLAFIAVSHDAIWALWLYTPLGKGGLGFSTSAIGSMLSLYGFLSVTVQLAFFPSLHRRLGTITCLRGALPGYFLVAALAPIITKMAQAGASRNTVYAMVAGLVLFKAMSNTAFASTSILVNSSSPSRNALGTVNGLAQMTASAVRTLGPAFIASTFAYGAQHRILDRQLAWYVLSACCLAACLSSFFVKDGSRLEQREDA